MRRVLAPFITLVLLAAVAGACGGDGGSGNQNGGNGSNGNGPTVTSPVQTVSGGSNATPTTLAELRTDLQTRLESIGVNIGAVPDDVREHLLSSCRGLEAFVEGGGVDEICNTIDQAIEQGDPGLIDVALQRLRELEAQ